MDRRFVAAAAFAACGAALAVSAAAAPTVTILAQPSSSPSPGFGESVGIDGGTVVVSDGYNDAAAVFVRSATSWVLQQKLVRDVPLGGSKFGFYVAVSGDTVVASAQGENSYGAGAAYVFVRSGTTWSQQQRLVGDVHPGSSGSWVFGLVAVSGDTLIVTENSVTGNFASPRAAYVYVRTGSVWSVQQKIPISHYGRVALDGDTAVLEDLGAVNSGDVYFRSGGVWSLQKALNLPAAVGTVDSVNVAVGGDTAVVARGADDPVYASVRSGSTWSEPQAIGNPNSTAGFFGEAVSLSGDTLVVGRHGDSNSGMANVFVQRGSAWLTTQTLAAFDAATDSSFGASVSLSGDTVVVGSLPQTRQAYVFDGIVGGSSVPQSVVASFFLPKSVKVSIDVKDATKSKLVAAGLFDTGPGSADLSASATLTVGGLSVPIPALSRQKNGSYRFKGGGADFSITPQKSGSSKAAFKLTVTGDLTGKIDPAAPLTLRFSDGVVDGTGVVGLQSGKYALGKVRGTLTSPDLFFYAAKATLAGGGKDALTVKAGLGAVGPTPGTAPSVTVAFGPYATTISTLVKKGDQFTYKNKGPGVTSLVLDYARETLVFTAKGIDLGTFAKGPQPVLVTVGDGTTHAVLVRMVHKGKTLTY